jgi:hypothetical protein
MPARVRQYLPRRQVRHQGPLAGKSQSREARPVAILRRKEFAVNQRDAERGGSTRNQDMLPFEVQRDAERDATSITLPLEDPSHAQRTSDHCV